MPKLLLIEDDDSVVRMYERLFVMENMQVTTALNGADGLKKAQDKPDIILLDIMMPVMNGLEVLKHLKADPVTKNIPVVILTNLSNDEDIKAALDLGADKYFVKSQHDPTVIADMVKQVLAEPPKSAANSAPA